MPKAKQWIRLYTEVVDDPKVQTLPPEQFKFWVNCLCLAGKHNGKLPNVGSLAWTLRETPEKIKEWTSALESAQLLENKGGDVIPHGWKDRQYEDSTSAERTRRYRERHCDVTVTSQETSHVTSEASHVTNMQRHRSVSVSASDSSLKDVSKDFGIFWARWGALTHRIQRHADALRAWIGVVEPGEEPAVMECLERYGASDEVLRGVVSNPEKWLYEQARDQWRGDWPAPKSALEIRSEALRRAIGDD